MQVAPTRFRVPDICLVARDAPDEQIVSHAPIACIEIWSRRDTVNGMQERVEDYQKFGVENVWVIDPSSRRGYDYKPGAVFDVTEFRVADTPIRMVLADIFADGD